MEKMLKYNELSRLAVHIGIYFSIYTENKSKLMIYHFLAKPQ